MNMDEILQDEDFVTAFEQAADAGDINKAKAILTEKGIKVSDEKLALLMGGQEQELSEIDLDNVAGGFKMVRGSHHGRGWWSWLLI